MSGANSRVETPGALDLTGQEFKSILSAGGNSSMSMSRESHHIRRNINPRAHVNKFSYRAISSKRAAIRESRQIGTSHKPLTTSISHAKIETVGGIKKNRFKVIFQRG